MIHTVFDESHAAYVVVWECDGCGDTAFGSEAVLEWARVTIGVETYLLCSSDCFYAWNYHVPWPGAFGDRPGDERGLEDVF